MASAGTIHTTREIEALIPHRWPMLLLVDRIVEYDAEAQADRRDQGRHRDRVVLPGPLPGPAGHARRPPGRGARPDDGRLRRQAAGLRRPDRALRRDRRRRFKRIVGPGDTLRLEVTMEKLGRRFGRGRGVASVDGEVACEATLSFIIPRRRRPPMTAATATILSDMHGNALALEAGAQGAQEGEARRRAHRRRPRPQRPGAGRDGRSPCASWRPTGRSSSRATPTSPSPTSTTRPPSRG